MMRPRKSLPENSENVSGRRSHGRIHCWSPEQRCTFFQRTKERRTFWNSVLILHKRGKGITLNCIWSDFSFRTGVFIQMCLQIS